MTSIELQGRTNEAYVAIHHSGAGPGLLLIADSAGLDAGIRARADLFGEEGYSVLALESDFSIEEIGAAAELLRGFPETDGGLGAIGRFQESDPTGG